MPSLPRLVRGHGDSKHGKRPGHQRPPLGRQRLRISDHGDHVLEDVQDNGGILAVKPGPKVVRVRSPVRTSKTHDRIRAVVGCCHVLPGCCVVCSFGMPKQALRCLPYLLLCHCVPPKNGSNLKTSSDLPALRSSRARHPTRPSTRCANGAARAPARDVAPPETLAWPVPRARRTRHGPPRCAPLPRAAPKQEPAQWHGHRHRWQR